MSCFPCGSAIICRGRQPPGEQGQLGWWQVPVKPAQSVAVCTFRELVTSLHSAPLVSKPPSSPAADHLFSKRSQRSAIPPTHPYLYNWALPGERRALASSLAPNWKAINPSYCTSQEKHSSPGLQIRTGQTDRHKSDPKRHIPSLLHTHRG